MKCTEHSKLDVPGEVVSVFTNCKNLVLRELMLPPTRALAILRCCPLGSFNSSSESDNATDSNCHDGGVLFVDGTTSKCLFLLCNPCLPTQKCS